MVTNFKKSFLLLITAIFFTQSLILGCSTEVDSEIKKMEEDKETSKTPVFVGTWDSFDETITIDDKFTFSLETKKESGTVQDVNNGFKCVSTTKDDKGNNKTYNFTKVEADVISSSDVVTGKTVYFVKHSDSQKDAELNGIWECDNGTEIIINAETKKICVTTENGQIWGTYTQNGNTFVIADENGNILGSGFVSASGKAYFYNEATDSFEIYTKDAEAGAPVIPLKKFTVTYKSEFADDVVKPCAENVEITLEDASYKGYRFDGWYTNAEKTTKAAATYTIAENLTFYAKWVQQVTVKFTSAQSEHADKVVDIGTEITIEDPTKEKFAFDGWFIGETKVSGKYTVTKDVELVAIWTALYNVTYETNGTPVKPETVRAGTKIKLQPTTLDGYDFEWWATEGKTYAIGAEYEVNSDVIFVAKWVGLCKVVYNTDGGSPVESKTVHDMETIEMPAAPTKDGHRFLGWYTTDENNLMQPGDVFNVTDSVTINAKWIAVYTYEYNDGIPADEDPNYQAPTVDDGYVLTLKAAPVKDGYVFKGWYDGENTYKPGVSYTITKDTVFTAEWNPEYTYQFEGSEAKTIENGKKITIADAPEAEGCTFAGWSDGTNTYQPGVEYEITDNVTFTAVWNVTVTYVSEYSQPEADVIKKGDSLVLPTLTHDGYSFGGWFVDADAPVKSPYTVDANITLTARWEKIPVTYSISGVPTNETWTSGTVVAWVWNDNVETGFDVKPTFDKGTADCSFKTVEDIKYCTIFVVDSMLSEPVTKDALTENATAKSADMEFSSGKAVFETYKEVYTITNVGIDNWYRGSEYENYIKISGDEESWVKAEYDDVNKILTFATDKEFDTCVACGFATDTIPEELDLSTYSGTLKRRSIILIMVGNTVEFAYDKHRQIGDTNTVYFRDEDSFQYNGDKNIYVYFSSSTDKELSELKVAMENCGNDNWFKAAVDYTKYDTVRFSGVQDGKMVYTTTLIMEKDKPYYRRYSSKPKQNGNYVLACCDNSSDDPDDLLNN